MAEWESAPNWTPFEEINGGQQFSKQFNAQALNALAENIAYLYKNRPEQDTTAIASDVVDEKTFYSEGKKQAGTMPMLRSLGSGAISIRANTNPTAPNGTLDIYVRSDHKTYVPESVGDGSFAAQIIEPLAVPANIAEGVTLFGIVGKHKGGETPPIFDGTIHVLPKNAINFTIDGNAYVSPSGWTWGDWCTSVYDPHGYFCADKVYKDSDYYIYGVTPYDVITDGVNYQTVPLGSENGVN